MKTKMKKTIKRIYNSNLFNEFFESEKSTGLILIACTIFSLFMANTIFGTQYLHLAYEVGRRKSRVLD
jgi:NhaA family Na+:H+ antiporter